MCTKVFGAGLDIPIGLVDLADAGRVRGVVLGLTCMTPTAAGFALEMRVEARFLIALRGQEQVREMVFVAIGAKQVDHLFEACQIPSRDGIFDPLDMVQIPLLYRVAVECADFVVPDEFVDQGF